MKNPTSKGRPTRRDFIAAVRSAAAGGIVLLSAGLIVKGYLAPEEARCRVAGACRGCPAAADCRFRTNQEDRHSRPPQ